MKYALITGASGEIGFSISEKLAASGYSLYLHYNKNIQKIMELQKRLEKYPIQVEIIQADLSNLEGAMHLISSIKEEVEVIIHNCGKSIYGLMTDLDVQTIQEQIQLQVTSPFLITKALLPSMISKKHGHIIFITSIWGQTGASCEVLYSSVKGAQNTLVKALAKEVAPSGIYVNGVAPGAIDTKMLSEFSEEDINNLKEEIPLGRLGTPKEIAETVAFLISEKASYITGHILSVNGGWYC